MAELSIATIEGMPTAYIVTVPIRWSDIDVNGHVNNARVATLLEEARVIWRADAVTVDGILDFEHSPVVASATTHYRRPVFYGGDFTVEITIAAIGNSSYTMAYVARQSGEVVIEATTVMVSMSISGSSRPLTTIERDYLGRWMPEAQAA